MDKFVRRLDLPERFEKPDERMALYALLADTLGVYYWCEVFTLRGFKPRKFCILGQRGLVNYAAKKIQQIYNLIQITAAQRRETIGWQFGAVISLRDALNTRRKAEILDAAYNEQMMASIYRSRHDLKTSYKVGHSDARAAFDIAGFDRGKVHPWDLAKLYNPLEAIRLIHENPERYGLKDVPKD
jgi:hypothetical protein